MKNKVIIENLSSVKRKFFEELGIFSDDDITESFFDVIQSYSNNFSEGESPVYDIVTHYPINTQLVFSNINEEELSWLSTNDYSITIKKRRFVI